MRRDEVRCRREPPACAGFAPRSPAHHLSGCSAHLSVACAGNQVTTIFGALGRDVVVRSDMVRAGVEGAGRGGGARGQAPTGAPPVAGGHPDARRHPRPTARGSPSRASGGPTLMARPPRAARLSPPWLPGWCSRDDWLFKGDRVSSNARCPLRAGDPAPHESRSAPLRSPSRPPQMLGGGGADWSQMTAALSAGEGGGAPRAIRDAQEPARGGVSSRAATLDRMLAATKQTALNEPASRRRRSRPTGPGPLVPSAVRVRVPSVRPRRLHWRWRARERRRRRAR